MIGEKAPMDQSNKFRAWRWTDPGYKIWELGLAVLVGLLFGVLVIIPPYLPLPSDFQKLVSVLPFAIVLVVLFNNLEKLILFAIAIGVPLNLDFSVIISPFARNQINLANGHRTIVAITELRVSFVLVVLVIGYIFWLIGRPGESRKPIRLFPSISIPALGLILLSILSIVQAQNVQLSFFKIAQLVELFLMFFYLANHLQTKKDIQFFVAVLMGMMLAEGLLMIVQWLTGWSFSLPGIDVSAYGQRAAGTFGQADVAGGIMAAQLAIVSAMIWIFPKRSYKLFAALCFLVGCIALISTAGRAAWGSFITVFLGFILIGWQRGWIARKYLVLLLLITIVIGGIFYPAISNRLTEDDRGSAASRPKMFRLAWNVIQASPSHFFLGVGSNNYALVSPAYNSFEVGDLGYIIDSSVHNVYLLTWAEIGLFGLLLLISFLGAPLAKAWRHIQSDDRFRSLMALGLGCALFAMCIQMYVDPFISRPKTAFVWLLISLIASLENIEATTEDQLH